MRTIRDLCRARRLRHTVDDAWGSDIIAAACVHMAATVDPDVHSATWIADAYIDGHLDRNGGVEVVDGWIAVPRGPGLGIDPDPDQLGDPVMTFS